MFGEKMLKNLWRISPKPPEIEAFLTWAREYALFVDSLDDRNADIEKFSVLDPILARKRIVYLGEEDHWVHEKSDYRLLMLRYLYSRGFRYIGEELGWSDGIRVDRYLETGDESYLSRIATYGYRGAIRTDRDDRPTGILKDSAGNYPVQAFKSEQIRLIKALRALGKHTSIPSERLHYFGFDLDVLAGGGYEDLSELINSIPDAPAVIELQSLLSRVPGETLAQEIQRLNQVINRINSLQADLKSLLGEAAFSRLQQWALTLINSFQFIQGANPATDYSTLNRAMAAREEAMLRHVQSVLSQMGPDGKLVLMGHNRHLSKDLATIKQAGAGAGPGGKRGPSLGTYLNRLLPDQVFSIWMLQGQGSSSQPLTSLQSEYTLQPGTLNAILAQVGSIFMLPASATPAGARDDPRARLLNRELDIVGIYNVIFRAVISQQADALFFVDKVSPLQV